MKIINVPIEAITIPSGHRPEKEQKVKAIAESMKNLKGPLQPAMIRKHRDTWILVFGKHRILAAKLNGETTFPCIDATHLAPWQIELAEIDENACRSELSFGQEAIALSEKKRIYRQQGIRSILDMDGTTQKMESPVSAAISDTAAKTGQARVTIESKMLVGDDLSPKAIGILDDHPSSNSKREMSTLAELPKQDQVEIAKVIASGKADTVRDALIDRVDGDDGLATDVLLAMNTDKIKPTKEQLHKLAKMPDARQKAIIRAVNEGKSLTAAMKPSATKPVASEPDKAKAQVKIWYDAVARWLGQSPSIDEYRKLFPGAKGDRVLAAAKEMYESLKSWHGAIK